MTGQMSAILRGGAVPPDIVTLRDEVSKACAATNSAYWRAPVSGLRRISIRLDGKERQDAAFAVGSGVVL